MRTIFAILASKTSKNIAVTRIMNRQELCHKNFLPYLLKKRTNPQYRLSLFRSCSSYNCDCVNNFAVLSHKYVVMHINYTYRVFVDFYCKGGWNPHAIHFTLFCVKSFYTSYICVNIHTCV